MSPTPCGTGLGVRVGLEDGRPDLGDQDTGPVGGLNEPGVETPREVARLTLPPCRDGGVALSASDVAARDRDVELVDNAVHDSSFRRSSC